MFPIYLLKTIYFLHTNFYFPKGWVDLLEDYLLLHFFSSKCYIMKNSQLTFPEVVKWLQIWSNLIVLINLNLKKSSKILKFSIKKSVTYKLMERNVLLIPPNIFWFPVNSDERILFTIYTKSCHVYSRVSLELILFLWPNHRLNNFAFDQPSIVRSKENISHSYL